MSKYDGYQNRVLTQFKKQVAKFLSFQRLKTLSNTENFSTPQEKNVTGEQERINAAINVLNELKSKFPETEALIVEKITEVVNKIRNGDKRLEDLEIKKAVLNLLQMFVEGQIYSQQELNGTEKPLSAAVQINNIFKDMNEIAQRCGLTEEDLKTSIEEDLKTSINDKTNYLRQIYAPLEENLSAFAANKDKGAFLDSVSRQKHIYAHIGLRDLQLNCAAVLAIGNLLSNERDQSYIKEFGKVNLDTNDLVQTVYAFSQIAGDLNPDKGSTIAIKMHSLNIGLEIYNKLLVLEANKVDVSQALGSIESALSAAVKELVVAIESKRETYSRAERLPSKEELATYTKDILPKILTELQKSRAGAESSHRKSTKPN